MKTIGSNGNMKNSATKFTIEMGEESSEVEEYEFLDPVETERERMIMKIFECQKLFLTSLIV